MKLKYIFLKIKILGCSCQQGSRGSVGKPGKNGWPGKPGSPGERGKSGIPGIYLEAKILAEEPCQRVRTYFILKKFFLSACHPNKVHPALMVQKGSQENKDHPDCQEQTENQVWTQKIILKS